jgi:hypothetical protein
LATSDKKNVTHAKKNAIIIIINRPDVVLHDEKKKTCLMIDRAIPDDSNVKTKETEKVSK